MKAFSRLVTSQKNNRIESFPPVFTLLLACVTLVFQPYALSQDGASEPARTLVGYSSELSVRPGDHIDFMVNTVNGGSYQADLVRVINGESRSIYGDKFKLEKIDATFEGTYQ